MKSELHIVTDLQYGSTGKGLFSGFLSSEVHPDTIISAWAPNAGHTFVNESGDKFVTTALPSGIFTAPDLKTILIGPGSVINPEQFLAEMEQFRAFLHGVEIMIHPYAAVVTEHHRKMEAAGSLAKIGSTLKGVSEAMIQKLQRSLLQHQRNVADVMLMGTPLEGFVVSVDEYNGAMDAAKIGLLEGAQGFSLSINHGFYPYTTSRDCTMAQLLSDCAIPCGTGNCEVVVYGVCRTFPIRVNNRNGSSGPCYEDQQEMDWFDMGIAPELTTVTKLPRRIFTFSEKQIRDAVRMNGVDKVFLNFANYCNGDDPDDLRSIISKINKYAPVEWLGYGPSISDIVPSNAAHGGEVGKFAGINA